MAKYDLVITGGRVIDPETNLDAVRNVGIKGGKIAAVTESAIEGKETIDATGHVVCPGFIDMHFHNVDSQFGVKLGLRDGVTTPLECEVGVYPVDKWYASHEGKMQANYGATVTSMGIREILHNPEFSDVFHGGFLNDIMADPKAAKTSMKWSTEKSTPEQTKKFGEMLDEGLSQGAIGVGHAVGYMTAGCSQEESILCQQMAGKYGRAVYVHGRFSSQMPPTSGILSFLEMMGSQEVYGGGIVFQHMHAQALSETMPALELFDAAQAKGIKVIGEIYPYNYGGTILGADYLHPDNYGPNMGRDYKDIIETATLTPYTKETYEKGVASNPMTSVLFYNSTEEDLYAGLGHPTTVLGSDAFPYTVRETGKDALDWDTPYDGVNGHPRGAGTHARLLALTRDKKVNIPLSLAVSKMTYMIADFLLNNGVAQMADKGRIQEGKDADITIFDPQTVTDNSTMKDGGLPSTGIPHVLVNGTVVVRDSKVLKEVFPGQPIHGTGKPVA
jgi:hypothetical protein